jgi:hypothetical protein
MAIIELVVIFIPLLLLLCRIKNNILRNILLITLECFFLLDLISIFSQNTHLNYQFLANIDFTALKVARDLFFLPIACGVVGLLLVALLTVKFSQKIFNALHGRRQGTVLLFLLILSLFSTGGIILTARKSFTGVGISGELEGKDQILTDLHLEPTSYLKIEDIYATPGKNIVVIYLESLEQNFLDEKIFPNLTPNLHKLIKEWNFYDNYVEVPGTGWTVGALYSTMHGLPAFFGIKGHKIFSEVEESNVISFGKILEKAGYKKFYLNGASLDYAEKRDMLRLDGYEAAGSDELSSNYDRHEWGVRDKEIFKEAKNKFLELSKSGSPFNLTLLTVDLHFPDGLPDESLREKIGIDLQGSEYVVKSTDYLLGDFLNFLKQQPNYEDTVIFILPDHTLMGNTLMTPAVKKLKQKERKLFLLTNAEIKTYPNLNEKITFYDIPILMLDGANVKSNAKFLKELKPDLDDSIKDNHFLNELTKFNLSLLQLKMVK